MPYILPQCRPSLKLAAGAAVSALTDCGNNPEFDSGELNFLISTIVWSLFERQKNYATGSALRGVLHDVDAEFYRRKMAPYEDTKIASNADLETL